MDEKAKKELYQFIEAALNEDIGDGDHTSLSTIPPGEQGKAHILIKDSGILAGIRVALDIFQKVDSSLHVNVLMQDGQPVKYGDVVMQMEGSVHSILKGERLVLNVMQRMSGIATITNKVVQLLSGTRTQVLDTRKTTPLLRFLEKAAVKIGGGVNHRFGLYDMILIKDNHVDFAGGIRQALDASNRYRQQLPDKIQIEIEVRSLNELREALEHG